MLLAAFMTLVSPLQQFPEIGALYAVGTHLNRLEEVVLAYLLLTYPSGHATGGFTGWLARIFLLVAPALALADLLTRPITRHVRSAVRGRGDPFLAFLTSERAWQNLARP